MSRPKNTIPEIRCKVHLGYRYAVVYINGRRHYLGRHGSEASKERYNRLIAECCKEGGAA